MTSDNQTRVTTLFTFPFRIFFVSTALWAVVAMPLWLILYRGGLDELPLALSGTAWHAHEMLFGFLAPAIAGFLLTAVCVWTKTDRTHGWALFGYWVAWLVGRATMLFGQDLPIGLLIAANVSFTALIVYDAAKRVLPLRQTRQYPLLVVLVLFGLLQGCYLWTQGDPQIVSAMLVLSMGVMLIVGGRITPGFSRNWLRKAGRDETRVVTLPWLEKATFGIGALLFVTLIAPLHSAVEGASWYNPVLAGIAAAASLIVGARILLWRGWLMRSVPILWILHISLFWIPIALAFLSLHALGLVTSHAWIHAMSAGAIGCLILGVMSRVVLGHTGRPLQLPKYVVPTYYLIYTAALIRVAVELLPPSVHAMGIDLSGVLWTLAFFIFLIRYVPMLMQPRVDGKKG